ncbi:MAG: DNRLRE domain-containing protein, partial [bacterium]
VSQCPTGEDPDQKPEAERRFAPGVHIYRGNDPALPGYCGNYLPMDLPYTFGQGKFKFEADWSLMPATFMGLGLMCNDDPLITMTEPTIIAPGAAPVQIFGRAGGKSKGTKLAASPPIILAPGDTYRIQGFDFGDAQGYQTASLAGQPLEVLEWTDNYIDVVIPEDAISGPIVVATTTGHSNALAVEIDYPPARAATMANRSFYVDVSNSGPEDGSKAHPWNSIQEAIDNLPEVSPKYIYVAAGTYYENIKLDKNHVYLIGAGPHETTINGLPRSFNLTSQGPNNGSGPVIFIGRGGIHGAKYDIHISSFTITGGNVNGDDIGCGIFADYGNHDLDINNCRIYRNGGYYGGGIWLHLSNHNVNIWSNLIAENGNYGGYGGGISVNDEPEYTEEHGQPEHIWDDYLPGPPPGTYEIYNNLIFHNWSFDYGGGICMYEIKDHLKLYGNVLLENKSEDHGAGMFFEDCGPIDIYGNVFLRNWTPDDGGAISFEDVGDTLSHVNIYNNLFAENIADDHGENHARGAALALDDVRDANIFNNTIVGNMVSGSFNPAGGGIDSERHGHEYSGQDGPYMAPGYSDPKIFNNIIWGNWRVHYDQVMEGGEEEDLDYTWSKNFVWTPDQLHVDNPHLQEEWENDNNTNSFSYVHNNIIQGGYDYNNQPPTADAGLNQALKDLDNSGSEPVTLDGSGSSDTDGTIVSYLWSENGAPLAYEANPTIDLPQGAHTLTLTVHDERGASHADLVNVTVIPNGPLSFNPTDDAFVRSNRANKNYGDTYEMRVRKSNSAKYHTYLKFNVNGLLGNVTSAKIQLKVINASNQGGSIYPAGNGWDEASLNWNNAPGTTGSSLSSVGAVGLGEIVEFDVTSAISGNGTFSFCISSNSSDAAIYSSKEGTYAPKLLVEFEMAGGNQAPVADAGPNQILSDGDSSGDEDVTLNGSGSYDTDGSIVNYDWSESGSSIASGVNPTVSLSVGVHTITLTVTDDQGATGTDDVVVTVNPGGGGAGSLTFNPIDDSFVRSNKATKNYGGSDELRVRRSSSAKYYTYLKFNVAGVGGAVTNAKLRLKVINASSEGGEIYSVANGWDEGSVNWNNAPALGGSALSSNGPVALGDMVEFDVTSAIAGDGTYSFGIKNSTSDAAKYSSKEGVYAPELVVDFGAGGGNQSPVADAGPNQDVTDADNNGSEGVTLDGSGSFDNDGTIVSYDWSEGGSSIATGLNPAVNLALGVHTITLTVTDNEGATGTDDVVVTVNPGGGGVPGTYTFNPTDDSFVRSNKATKVYGASDELRVRITSKKIYAFLKFNVSGLGGAVVSAKVRLKAINGSNDGGGIYTVENGWDEGSLNWNNAPPIAGAPLSSVGAMATGDMVEFDVTGAIFGNGTYSFAIKNASSDAAKYSSKEGVYAPELVVETTTPGPILAIAKNGAIGLNWNKIANGFGFSGLKGTNGHLQAIGGNLDLDPQFVDPASLNWRLQSNSPAIDQADAGMGAHVDLERLPRSVVNGMIDMGAFEWRANSPMVLRIPTGILGSVPIPTPGSSQLYP